MLLTYLGRRLALAVVALFGVIVTAFLVAHSVPADPLATVLSEQATKDPSIRAAYMKRWGLDRPLPEQFVAYLTNVLRGDLGESFTTRRPVLQDLKQFLPATIELSLAALAVAVCFGVPLGVWAAVHHNRLADHVARAVSLIGAASPIFWTGLIALYVFYYRLELGAGPWPPGQLPDDAAARHRLPADRQPGRRESGAVRVDGRAPRPARPRPRLVHHGAHRAHDAVVAAGGSQRGLRAAPPGRRGSARAWSWASTRCETR